MEGATPMRWVEEKIRGSSWKMARFSLGGKATAVKEDSKLGSRIKVRIPVVHSADCCDDIVS